MVGRPGLHALLRAAAAGEVDAVPAESLEGEIDEMAIGFTGTMHALFLKALASKNMDNERSVSPHLASTSTRPLSTSGPSRRV